MSKDIGAGILKGLLNNCTGWLKALEENDPDAADEILQFFAEQLSDRSLRVLYGHIAREYRNRDRMDKAEASSKRTLFE